MSPCHRHTRLLVYFSPTLVLLKMTSLLVWGAPDPASSTLLSPVTSASLTLAQSQARAVSCL